MSLQTKYDAVNNVSNASTEKIDRHVVSVFETVSLALPDKIALVDGTVKLTYHELNKQANILAAQLRTAGIVPGGTVAVCLPQSSKRVIAFLAILKTGSAYLAIDAQLPDNRVKMMLEDAEVKIILTEDPQQVRFTTLGFPIINLDKNTSTSHNPASEVNVPVSIHPRQMAYIIYTSGSTGIPKGVAIHHEAFYHFVKVFGDLWGFSSDQKALQFASPNFDTSIIDLWIPLLKGATVFLYPDNKIVGRPLLEYIVENEIDVVPFLSPAVLATLPVNEPIGKLRTIMIAGELPAEQTIRNWYKRVKLINVYGPTETTVSVVTHHWEEDPNPRIIGKPLEGSEIFILDKEHQPLDAGIQGEIYIGGIQVGLGYVNRPEETQAAYVKAPEWLQKTHGPDYILYKTGDRAFWRPDGTIEFIGRMDDQVKIRGFRVELSEIEHHISQLAQVVRASVIVHRPENGLPMLAAFVQLYEADKSNITANDIRARLQQSLPSYMLPDRIVLLEKLPLTTGGKIDKQQLRLPAQMTRRQTQDRTTIQDLTQEVKEIWKDLLSLDEIYDDDDFFELGGHSLMLAQLHERLPQNVRQRITLPELYKYSTISNFVKEAQSRLQQVEVSQQQKAKKMEELLRKDSELPFDFEITVQPDPKVLASPSHIFLTGATGFVGSNLLEQLIEKHPQATIHCLVRAENQVLALERIKSTFQKFKLVWHDSYASHLSLVLGDLTSPRFGVDDKTYSHLIETIEVIYHIGSSVSYVQPYEVIKKPNVDGLSHVLHLAVNGKTKFLVQSSSAGVYSWGRSFTGKTWMSEDDPIDQNLPAVCRDMGYIRSKWVMENMVAKAKAKGLPVINFRLGFVVCHSETGATAMNQWWGALMRSCIELKSFPLVMALKDELVSVDYVAKSIAHIGKKPEAIGLNFNLTPLPEHDLSITDFCVKISDYFDFEMKGLEYHSWFSQWRRNQDVPVYALLSLFTEDVHEGKSLVEAYENTYYCKRDNTEKFLSDSDIQPTVFNKKVMEAYLRFMGVL
jgi:amino acid adenylation domain-containing protein/thioester reductase-like protein